jgi:peptidoglycan/LPS O-acetylase OafA/YrhL
MHWVTEKVHHRSMILNLQALRAYAAMLVLFFHSLGNYRAMGGSFAWYEAIGEWGFAGVDVFFVLSGYVIARSTTAGKGASISPATFLYRRFGRIYLGYWPFFLFSMILAGLFYPHFLENKKILASALLLTPNTEYSVVTPAWSLTYELYFYAFTALTLAIPARYRSFLLLAWFSAVVIKAATIEDGRFASLDFFFSSFVLEFLAGFVLFKMGAAIHKTWVLVISIAAMVIFVTLGVVQEQILGIGRVLTWGAAATCLVMVALILERKRILIADRFSVALGDASYTFYLCHTIFLALFYSLGIREWLVARAWIESGFFAYLVFIMFFSVLFYKAVEHPLYVAYLSKGNRFHSSPG